MPPQTRNRKADSANATTVVLQLDGRTYSLTLEHVPATIALRVRAETGHALAWWLDQLAADDGEPDIDAAAVFVWAAQLYQHEPSDGPAPKLADVLELVTYGSELTQPDDPAAEAEAAGKATGAD